MILVDQAPLHHVFKSQLLTSIGIEQLNVNFNVGFNNYWKTWQAKFSHSRQFEMIAYSNFPYYNGN